MEVTQIVLFLSDFLVRSVTIFIAICKASVAPEPLDRKALEIGIIRYCKASSKNFSLGSNQPPILSTYCKLKFNVFYKSAYFLVTKFWLGSDRADRLIRWIKPPR